ncbi:MAG TPA: homoserine dehydrogenase [Actinomycetes bacterium]|nr:homoserine dehydrogenase [Actinomycetes bacterium]
MARAALSTMGERQVRDVRLCILGFGHVTQRFCEMVREHEHRLASEHGVRFLVTAVGTGSHGSWLDSTGQTPREVLKQFRANGERFPDAERLGLDLIKESGAKVLVEATPLTQRGEPAISHVDAAFDAGMDVVTVNKGPIAWDYRRLRDRADSEGRGFRHEGVTMDGCPVYNLVEYCLPGDRVMGFRGVLNSTTNYVLDTMAEGASMDEAIREAVDAGIAETDPSYDIEGHDAAAKVAALANVLLEADLTPDKVERESMAGLTPDDVAKVLSYGRRLRLIGEASRDEDGSVTARVALIPTRSQDPMYWIAGTSSCLILETELAGTVEIVERDGLVTQTAYAVYADLLTLTNG